MVRHDSPATRDTRHRTAALKQNAVPLARADGSKRSYRTGKGPAWTTRIIHGTATAATTTATTTTITTTITFRERQEEHTVGTRNRKYTSRGLRSSWCVGHRHRVVPRASFGRGDVFTAQSRRSQRRCSACRRADAGRVEDGYGIAAVTGGRGRLVGGLPPLSRAYIILLYVIVTIQRDRRRTTLPLLPCHHRRSRRPPRDIDNNVRARERVCVRASVRVYIIHVRVRYNNSGRWAVGGVVALAGGLAG